MIYLAQLVVVNVLLRGRIALEQQLLTVDRQVAEVRQRTHHAICLLELAEAKALRLIGLRVLPHK